MSINSIDSANSINPIQNNNRQMMQKKLDAIKNKFGEDSFQFSVASKMMNMMSGLSAENKADMKLFRTEMMQAVKSGNIDFTEMADKAPDFLKSFSEENGLNLEEALGKMAERKENMYAKMGAKLPLGASGTEELNIMDLLFSVNEEKEE
jgi:hypothetical protein